MSRSSGVLLAVTSLPSLFGVGDLGPAARTWVDRLAAGGQTWWQVLPVGPFGAGDSPYASFSTFAGETLLISPEDLVADGLLEAADLAGPAFADGTADYDRARPVREGLLARAWERFRTGAAPALRGEFDAFVAGEREWLEDWALYAALKAAHGGASWETWPEELRLRARGAVKRAEKDLAVARDEHRFRQFLWHRQWAALRRHAAARGVKLLGDMPIFVAEDSCDAWATPGVFRFGRGRRPAEVAGVPPDYFSADGQLWGNPVYDWKAQARSGFAWWVRRARHASRRFDLVRLDHFRGFAAAWHIPAGAKTAREGRWVPGPGMALFGAIRTALGGLPFVAEDLGLITRDVRELRAAAGLPGMRVLQFAFDGDPDNTFLPHNIDRDSVIYTGTHDNDTSAGWWAGLDAPDRQRAAAYLRTDGHDIAWDLIRMAWSTVADLALAPLQDVLMLGPEGRMNVPGVPSRNWRWRVRPDAPVGDRLAGLRELSRLYARLPRGAGQIPGKGPAG